ncbi:MAG: TetR/AcrR family transcriptional regulator [Alphaproteobacteria bacterium]|nr:TetR/AcrR family transcriptional regulator [Alphaproteobacteria bacterium]
MLCKDTVRGNILEAAKKRFLHYGYAKTTMAEIASDCSMSPGNLYRYFPGKLDIAEAICTEAGEYAVARLREVMRRPSRTARERLRDFLFADMKLTYDQLEYDKQVFEMARVVASERPQFANRILALNRALLSEILAAGNASSEFFIEDVVFTAEMLQSATMKFRYPQLHSKLPYEKLERELDGVVNLLLNGLDDGGAGKEQLARQAQQGSPSDDLITI